MSAKSLSLRMSRGVCMWQICGKGIIFLAWPRKVQTHGSKALHRSFRDRQNKTVEGFYCMVDVFRQLLVLLVVLSIHSTHHRGHSYIYNCLVVSVTNS